MKFLLLSSLLFLLTGCAMRPLKPGLGFFVAPGGLAGGIQQSENPQSSSKQTYRRSVTDAQGKQVTDEFQTEIGAAQKDVAREMAAKLSSLKGVVWVGIAVFLFGVASAFWPPLKVVVGSITTSAVIAAAGIALIVLPSLLVGNELLILFVAGGAILLYWFAHRHSAIHSELKTLRK